MFQGLGTLCSEHRELELGLPLPCVVLLDKLSKELLPRVRCSLTLECWAGPEECGLDGFDHLPVHGSGPGLSCTTVYSGLPRVQPEFKSINSDLEERGARVSLGLCLHGKTRVTCGGLS